MYSVKTFKQLRNSKIDNFGPLCQLILRQSKSTNIDMEYIQNSKVPTMHFQQSLPRLPIPKLEDTCRRYLNAQKPLLNDDQFKKTESHVHHFLKVNGLALQKELQQIDSKNSYTSYISEPWFDMYLRDRKPLPINYNPAIIYTPESDPRFNDPLIKATNLIVSSIRFVKSLRAEILEPDVFHLNPKKSNTKLFRTVTGILPRAVSWYGAYFFNAYPLDMSQYKNLFNTTRIPCKDKDVIVQDVDTRHLVVLRNGHFYSFDVLDKNGSIVSPRQIASNLKHILNDNRPLNDKAVGILTASDRDDWAEARRHLTSIEDNSRVLQQIDSALFVLVLEDETAGEVNEILRMFLHGNAKNRWYDKSFSLIVTKDGHSGINFEHSWGDGVAVLRYFQDLKKDIEDRPAIHPDEVDQINKSPSVQKLDFRLDSKMESILREEGDKFRDWIDDLDVDCMIYEGFGKDNCKKYKISPDAVMQLSFQLALFRMENRSVATYESCSTAAFKHGRTETIRPCTLQTKNFCRAMVTRTIKDSMSEFKKMLLDCSVTHSQLVKEAAMGQGFDRHLFALKRISEMENRKQGIFEDPAYRTINHNILSTSTLSSPVVLAGGFGPVARDGYGIGYMIHDKKLGAVVTSYKKQRKAADYVKSLETSILDIIRVLSIK